MQIQNDSIIIVKLCNPPFPDHQAKLKTVNSPFTRYKLNGAKTALVACDYDEKRAAAAGHQPLAQQRQHQPAKPRTAGDPGMEYGFDSEPEEEETATGSGNSQKAPPRAAEEKAAGTDTGERTGKKQKPDLRAEMAAALKQTIRPCTELGEVAIPKREEIMGQWFLEGDLGFIFAPRGLGKTWLALAIASAIGNGGRCGPWFAAQPRKVLYVDGEMPYDECCTRSTGLEGNSNLCILQHEALFHLAGKTLNLADPVTQEALTTWMLAAGTKVLTLDNLSCLFMGIKENEADAWECILHWLLTLRRHRIAVIVVHHSGRNLEMRGTSRREDAAFWVLRLDEIKEVEGKHGAVFLSRFTKDRNSKKEQPPLKWSIQTGGDGSVAIAFQETRGLDAFRRWIEDGLEYASDIATEMNVTKGYIARLAKKAMDEGWLKKEGRKYVLV